MPQAGVLSRLALPSVSLLYANISEGEAACTPEEGFRNLFNYWTISGKTFGEISCCILAQMDTGAGFQFCICLSWWCEFYCVPVVLVKTACIWSYTFMPHHRDGLWTSSKKQVTQRKQQNTQTWNMFSVRENSVHTNHWAREKEKHTLMQKSQHRNSKSGAELCTPPGSGLVNSPLHCFILVYSLLFSRFCVGDKFFLKNNMILCQMDYEEGQLNGSFETQVQ